MQSGKLVNNQMTAKKLIAAIRVRTDIGQNI